MEGFVEDDLLFDFNCADEAYGRTVENLAGLGPEKQPRMDAAFQKALNAWEKLTEEDKKTRKKPEPTACWSLPEHARYKF